MNIHQIYTKHFYGLKYLLIVIGLISIGYCLQISSKTKQSAKKSSISLKKAEVIGKSLLIDQLIKDTLIVKTADR